jgi:hypothetical protein
MRKVRSLVNIGLWLLFSVPFFTSLIDGAGESSLFGVRYLCLFGLTLAAVSFSLRNMPRIQFRWNVSWAFVFLILYVMIGFPNLRGPGGNIPGGPLAMLFVIGMLPLTIFTALRPSKIKRSA